MRRYAQYVSTAPGAQRRSWVQELTGRTLLCDCAPGQPCHGEVLADLVAAACPYSNRPRLVSRASLVQGGRVTSAPAIWTAAPGTAAAGNLPRSVSQDIVQEALARNIKKLFPHHYLDRVPLPFLEDIINNDIILGFSRWMDVRGVFETGGGRAAGVGGTGWRYVALGTQGGALASKRSIDPILGFGQEAEVQFQAAETFARGGYPPMMQGRPQPTISGMRRSTPSRIGHSSGSRGSARQRSSRSLRIDANP